MLLKCRRNLTAREVRIIRNLIANNVIWEAVGRNYFTQFDESSGREIRIRLAELQRMEGCGWIRLVHPPKAAQRLDHYQITPHGASVEGLTHAKSPAA